MSVIKGIDFNMYVIVSGVPTLLCHARDFTIEITTETLEISDPTTFWQKFLGGYSGYNLSAAALTSYDSNLSIVQLQEYQMQRAVIGWMGGTSVPGGLVYSGSMLITSIRQTSPFRDVTQYDLSAVGTGAPVISKLPITQAVYLANTLGIRLPGCPDPYPVAVIWYDGTVIGLATNADEVMTVFNSYAGNLFYQLTGNDGGCNFTMQIAWNAPTKPTFVIAEQSPDAAIMVGIGNGIISNDQDNSQAITPLGQ